MTQRAIIGSHPGLFEILIEALSLIDLRDDLDDDVRLDHMDLLELLLINLPGREISDSLPDFYQAIRHIHDSLHSHDIQDHIFDPKAIRVEIDGDRYLIYLEDDSCRSRPMTLRNVTTLRPISRCVTQPSLSYRF